MRSKCNSQERYDKADLSHRTEDRNELNSCVSPRDLVIKLRNKGER